MPCPLLHLAVKRKEGNSQFNEKLSIRYNTHNWKSILAYLIEATNFKYFDTMVEQSKSQNYQTKLYFNGVLDNVIRQKNYEEFFNVFLWTKYAAMERAAPII